MDGASTGPGTGKSSNASGLFVRDTNSPDDSVDRFTQPYRYCPVLDSVSIARDALAFLPVTNVRM
jgi:hypothetical protein